MRRTHHLTLTALMAALLCIAGPLTIPVGPVPVSLASAVLLLSALLLGGRMATVSCGVYLLIGLMGLPVLSGFTGGASRLLGPTGGYMVGYLFLTAIAGAACARTDRRLLLLAGMAVGTAVLYLFGTAWYCMQSGVNASAALAVCVWPFIPFDAVKIAVVTFFGPRLKDRLVKAGLV
ncbi:MAG: biotin transporter BioY [Clostridia bacterium]|nr:biotin transporter BioY [Clostridia bacterium]